jgi:hyperosmotically inducible protein
MGMKKITYALLLAVLGLGAGCAKITGGGDTTAEPAAAAESATTDRAQQRGPSDSAITSAVKEAFQKDELLGSLTINVNTDNGVVTLDGRVPNGRVMNRAISLARSVPGVRRVNTQLEIP